MSLAFLRSKGCWIKLRYLCYLLPTTTEKNQVGANIDWPSGLCSIKDAILASHPTEAVDTPQTWTPEEHHGSRPRACGRTQH